MRAQTGKGVSSQDRKKILLAVLVFIFALALTYRLLNPYKQERAPTLTYTGERNGKAVRTGGTVRTGNDSEISFIRLDLLTHPPAHSGKTTRDIFHRATLERTENEVPKSAPPPDEKENIPSVNEPQVDDKRVKVQEELSRFRAFGYLDKGEERLLFLERGKDILVVRKGDRIDGKYLVVEIDENLLTLRAEEINEDVKIDLSRF